MALFGETELTTMLMGWQKEMNVPLTSTELEDQRQTRNQMLKCYILAGPAFGLASYNIYRSLILKLPPVPLGRTFAGIWGRATFYIASVWGSSMYARRVAGEYYYHTLQYPTVYGAMSRNLLFSLSPGLVPKVQSRLPNITEYDDSPFTLPPASSRLLQMQKFVNQRLGQVQDIVAQRNQYLSHPPHLDPSTSQGMAWQQNPQTSFANTQPAPPQQVQPPSLGGSPQSFGSPQGLGQPGAGGLRRSELSRLQKGPDAGEDEQPLQQMRAPGGGLDSSLAPSRSGGYFGTSTAIPNDGFVREDPSQTQAFRRF